MYATHIELYANHTITTKYIIISKKKCRVVCAGRTEKINAISEGKMFHDFLQPFFVWRIIIK